MISMELADPGKFEKDLLAQLGPRLENALKGLVAEIVEELPRGNASSIAPELVVKQVDPGRYQILASDVWTYLNDGTGIFSGGKHAGAGVGGRIVPKNAKVLHFRNRELAVALGFKTEDVFLASVKGIQPRFYWDRAFTQSRVTEKMAEAKGKV